MSAPSAQLPLPLYATAMVALMWPLRELKKNCTAFSACCTLRSFGSVGLLSKLLCAVPVNVPAATSTSIVDVAGKSDVGRSGVT